MFKKFQKIDYAILVIFIITFLVGAFVFKDYGISWDEPLQRNHTLVNYQFILNNIFNYDLPKFADTSVSSFNFEVPIPILEGYYYRYYGVFIQLPMVFIEHLFHFDLSEHTIYLIKHFYTFTIVFTGNIAFFFTLLKIFKNKMIAVLGFFMLAYYPRFFAEQFYNIKDMVFVAFFSLSIYATVLVIEHKRKLRYIVLFSFIVAVATNVRVIGIVFMPLLVLYLLVEDLIKTFKYHQTFDKKSVLIYLEIIVLFFVFYVLITPITWTNPIQILGETLTGFLNYSLWDGYTLFMGEVIRGQEVPWYYIPVWIGITVPVWYLIYFFYYFIDLSFKTSKQFIYLIKESHKNIKILFNSLASNLIDGFITNRYTILMFTLLFAPYIVMVISKSTLYNAWRHVYFMLIPIIYLALIGILKSYNQLKNIKINLKYITVAVVTLGILYQSYWLIANHPFQYIYFNMIGAPNASDYARDYWSVSDYQAFKYLINHEETQDLDVITITDRSTDLIPLNWNLDFLDEYDSSRVELTYDGVGDYLICTYRNIKGNDCNFDGFEEWHSFEADGFKFLTIYKKIEE